MVDVIIGSNHLKFKSPTLKQIDVIKAHSPGLTVTVKDQATIVEGVPGLLYSLLHELCRTYDVNLI